MVTTVSRKVGTRNRLRIYRIQNCEQMKYHCGYVLFRRERRLWSVQGCYLCTFVTWSVKALWLLKRISTARWSASFAYVRLRWTIFRLKYPPPPSWSTIFEYLKLCWTICQLNSYIVYNKILQVLCFFVVNLITSVVLSHYSVLNGLFPS
jgi:hypothetical protein